MAERFGLSEADLVAIAELACHEPGCPPIETVVTVHESKRPLRIWRLHKPLSDIVAADIEALEALPLAAARPGDKASGR